MRLFIKGFALMLVLFVITSVAQAKPATIQVTIHIATLPDFTETVPYQTYDSLDECKAGLDQHVLEELIRLPEAVATEIDGKISIFNDPFLAVAECVEEIGE